LERRCIAKTYLLSLIFEKHLSSPLRPLLRPPGSTSYTQHTYIILPQFLWILTTYPNLQYFLYDPASSSRQHQATVASSMAEHGVVTAHDWIRGISFSVLASIIGGASKLSIRKSCECWRRRFARKYYVLHISCGRALAENFRQYLSHRFSTVYYQHSKGLLMLGENWTFIVVAQAKRMDIAIKTMIPSIQASRTKRTNFLPWRLIALLLRQYSQINIRHYYHAVPTASTTARSPRCRRSKRRGSYTSRE